MEREHVVQRLEHAGRTLLAMSSPAVGPRSKLVSGWYSEARAAIARTSTLRNRFVPPPHDISAMDRSFQLLGLIPDERLVLRRVVGARSLVDPVTDRHVYSWRHLGDVLGAHHASVKAWHAEGITIIWRALKAQQVAVR